MDVDEDIKTLVSFRAGRMQLADKRLCADPRKGIFRVMNIEGLVHMQWIERNEDGSPVDKPEVDQVVFDGECNVERIGNPSARVFVVKFPEDKSRSVFFWLQEKENDRDSYFLAKVSFSLACAYASDPGPDPAQISNDFATPAPTQPPLQTPAAPVRQPAVQGGSGSQDAPAEEQMRSLLQAMETPAAAAKDQSAPLLDPHQLAELMQRVAGARHKEPTLGELLRPDVIRPFLLDEPIQQKLVDHMPVPHRNMQGFSDLVSSAQLRQQLDMLSYAILKGSVDARQFGIEPVGPGIANFLEAIQRHVEREQKKKEEEKGREEKEQ